MCGFTGALSFNQIDINELIKANKCVECRGPDSLKTTSIETGKANSYFVFNRLAILDLSTEADQPMHSDKFKTSLMFNGEIFNHSELRAELKSKGLKFKTSHSDTETVLSGLSFYGMEFVKRLRGQFSIFFVDEKINKAYFIRDRLGQKPLYYSHDSLSIFFGSNLKSITKMQNTYELSEEGVNKYLKYGIVKSPNSIIKNIFKVQPGQIVEVDFNNSKFNIKTSFYWLPEDFIDNKEFDVENFYSLLSESIQIRNEADVPIANFLSGGIDSTSIVKNLHDNGLEINTFSIYVDNEKYDESNYIKEVVKKYQTNHKFVKISSRINNENIFEGLKSLDEPYYDPSVIPSYIISKEISKYYKVAISGDGGDELLGGYERTINNLKKKSVFQNIFSNIYYLYPPIFGSGNKFLKNSNNVEKNFRSFIEDNKLLSLLNIKSGDYDFANNLNSGHNIYKNLLVADYKFYLSEMMMFKVDRTSMANSLEVRSPFVDHKLIEYILSTNNEYLDLNHSKKLLKNYLYKDFSENFINRPKKGFVFDVENWVYNNIDFIDDVINQGKVVKSMNKNILKNLSINKSRINGIRIWKLFVLESYLLDLKRF